MQDRVTQELEYCKKTMLEINFNKVLSLLGEKRATYMQNKINEHGAPKMIIIGDDYIEATNAFKPLSVIRDSFICSNHIIYAWGTFTIFDKGNSQVIINKSYELIKYSELYDIYKNQ